jgi:hypothetical protein
MRRSSSFHESEKLAIGLFKKVSPEKLMLREAESQLTHLVGTIGRAVGHGESVSRS